MADAGAECRVLGALATFKILAGHQKADVPVTLEALRLAALRTDERSALWEWEHLRSQWEVHLGKFQNALARLEKIKREMGDNSKEQFRVSTSIKKLEIEVQMGALQWLMGRPGIAVQTIQKAADQAMGIRHGLTLIHCHSRGIIFTMCECHDFQVARSHLEILKRTIYHHGMASWISIADCYNEVIAALSGDRVSTEGLRSARDALQQAPIQLRNAAYFVTLTRAMVAIGQFDDAAQTIDYLVDEDPQPWLFPEVLRLRAATVRAFGSDANAENCCGMRCGPLTRWAASLWSCVQRLILRRC